MAMQLINVISQSTTFDKHHLTVVTLVLVLHSDDLQTHCVLPIEFLTTKYELNFQLSLIFDELYLEWTCNSSM